MKPELLIPDMVMVMGVILPTPALGQLGAAKRAAQRVAESGSQRKLPDESGSVPRQYQGNRPAPAAPVGVAAAAPAAVKAADLDKQAADKKAAVDRVVALTKERAEKGRSAAQFDLGMRYLSGDGVPSNPKLGREWIEKSAKQGETDAVKKLKELDAVAAAEAASVAGAKPVKPKP